jgi:phosphatidylserine decarboxylase
MLKPLAESLFALLQYPLPHHPLSRVMHKLTRCENRFFKNVFIKTIIALFKVNMAEAQETNLDAYPSFNAFFTRLLKPEVRPLCPEKGAVLCPADGAVSQLGKIANGRIFQAKGKDFSAVELLGGDVERAKPFANGSFATIYLSPRDYHRLHMPLRGTLRQMIHVPGRLFSVNAATTNNVPGLFARNERVVAMFDTEVGPMALVLVGAIFVASIETVWHGEVTPPTATEVRIWDYAKNPLILDKGAEMGRFNMGSTIVVLFGENAISWEEALAAGDAVRMGQKIGAINV